MIELLVVIAIIGILVAIIAVSVVSLRAHGRDSSILSHLGQIRAQAEIAYSSTGGYDVICVGDELNSVGYPDTLGVINQEVGRYNGSVTVTCHADTENYCVQSPLNVSGYFCLDSSGFSGVISGANCGVAGNIRCQ